MAFLERTADVEIAEFTNDCSLDFDCIESDVNSDFNRLASYLGGSEESDNDLDVCSPPLNPETGKSAIKSPPNMAFHQSSPSSHERASSLDTVVVAVTTSNSSSIAGERCMTKPAILARERRKKQKEYLQQLESQVENLQQENEVLTKRLETEVGDRDKTISQLSDEVKYLRSVLANDSSLSVLLTNVVNTQGLTVRGSMVKEKSQSPPDSCRESVAAVGPELRSRGARGGVTAPKSGKRSHTGFQDENCDPVPSKISRRNTTSSAPSPLEVEAGAEQVITSPVHVSMQSSILVPDETRSSVSSLDAGVEKEMSEGNAGVCLHVSGKDVSIELCMACNRNAIKNRILNDHDYTRTISS